MLPESASKNLMTLAPTCDFQSLEFDAISTSSSSDGTFMVHVWTEDEVRLLSASTDHAQNDPISHFHKDLDLFTASGADDIDDDQEPETEEDALLQDFADRQIRDADDVFALSKNILSGDRLLTEDQPDTDILESPQYRQATRRRFLGRWASDVEAVDQKSRHEVPAISAEEVHAFPIEEDDQSSPWGCQSGDFPIPSASALCAEGDVPVMQRRLFSRFV